jgi:hypothetical protein
MKFQTFSPHFKHSDYGIKKIERFQNINNEFSEDILFSQVEEAKLEEKLS